MSRFNFRIRRGPSDPITDPSGDFPGAPLSVTAPVQGTSLLNVWNLQKTDATGPRVSPTNGSWGSRTLAAAGGPTGDAYLDGLGFVVNNTGDGIYLNCGAATKTIEKYDFTGLVGSIAFEGSTANPVNWVDCTFGGDQGLQYPHGINAGTYNFASNMVVNFSYCLFDKATFTQGSGIQTNDHCRFKNQLQGLGDSAFNNTNLCKIFYDDCFITGGGVYAPQTDPVNDLWSHIELTQMINSHPDSGIFVTRCMFDFTQDGQTTTLSRAGWTGVFSGGPHEEMTDCIVKGLPQIDANPNAPNKTNCILAYGDGVAAVLTNTAADPGLYGYTFNQTDGGTPYAGRNGGGNRTFAGNTAITTADLG